MNENEKKDMMFEEIDGELVEPKKPEEPKEEPKDEEEVEKTSALKKVGRIVTAPARWIFGKLKKAPDSAFVGSMIGGGLAIGGKLAYDHFVKGHSDPGEADEAGDETDVPDNIVEFGGPTDEDDMAM